MARQWTDALAALCLATLTMGCAGPVTRLEVEHLRQDGTISGHTHHACDYALWKVRSKDNEHQIARFTLSKGDVLGFDTTGGSLVAVAGDNRYPLEPGWYRWYRIVPTGEVAGEVSLRIALFPFMLAAASGGAP